MPTTGANTDPRALITPDAFEVSEELLGLPLAAPSRRLVAILIDLVVIGVITAVTQSFALVLGIVVAVAFVRASFKRTQVRGGVFGRAMRASLGCLGVFIGLLTMVLWILVGAGLDRGSTPEGDELDFDQQLELALEAAGLAGVPIDGVTPRLPAVVDTGSAVPDTIRALQERIARQELRLRAQRIQIEALEEARAGASEEGGIFDVLRGLVDELGFGFGWASLYMTLLLTLWKGQTVGKRMVGIRVVRLDGEPINWWLAFERAGGYAAGFATGLLGFAQVYWDANRQAIHDRIAGTVVVRDGAERIGNWESAL